jgi:transposase
VATVQLRNPKGRGYYDRKKAGGKSSMAVMYCLKRRLSDIVYRTMLADIAVLATAHTTPAAVHEMALSREATGATTLNPARPAHNPNTGSSDKPRRTRRSA